MKHPNIKAILLDIDGVIVGEKVGINSPTPNKLVSDKLKKVNQSGIPIYLCTAKPHFSIGDVIKQIGLTNSHITDAGAVVIDPVNKKIDLAEYIPKILVEQITNLLISENIYTELYSVDDYYIEKRQQSDTTEIHEHILQKPPIVVADLAEKSKDLNVIKIMPVIESIEQATEVEELLHDLKSKYFFNFGWGIHPVALPRQFGIITKSGVSKREAALNVFRELNISFNNILAIGDSVSDWKFMELCEFVGTVDNAEEKLKDLITEKEKGNWFVGPSVDDNGVIDILEHYGL